jgi:hypothetical protein
VVGKGRRRGVFSEQADYFFPLVLGTWLPGWSGLVMLVVEFVEVCDLFKEESDCVDLEGSEMLFLQISVVEDAILKFCVGEELLKAASACGEGDWGPER